MTYISNLSRDTEQYKNETMDKILEKETFPSLIFLANVYVSCNEKYVLESN